MVHTYKIHGMTCEACVAKIIKALSEDFQNINVSLANKTLSVEGNNADNIKNINDTIQKKAGSKYSVVLQAEAIEETSEVAPTGVKTFLPLILVVSMILGGTFLLGARMGEVELHKGMLDFMGLFFIFFSFFKFLDIQKFAESYFSYDLISKKWFNWGYFYPFIELYLGIAYLLELHLFYTNLITGVLMLLGFVSVLKVLAKKSKIKCACLGGLFNLPMTTVTLVETGVMAIMSIYMLF